MCCCQPNVTSLSLSGVITLGILFDSGIILKGRNGKAIKLLVQPEIAQFRRARSQIALDNLTKVKLGSVTISRLCSKHCFKYHRDFCKTHYKMGTTNTSILNMSNARNSFLNKRILFLVGWYFERCVWVSDKNVDDMYCCRYFLILYYAVTLIVIRARTGRLHTELWSIKWLLCELNNHHCSLVVL